MWWPVSVSPSITEMEREDCRAGRLATLPASGKPGHRETMSQTTSFKVTSGPTLSLPWSPICRTHRHAQPGMHCFCNKRVSVLKVSYYLKAKTHSFNSCDLAATWAAVLHICVEEYKGPSPQSQLSDSTSRERQTTDISLGQLELDSVSPGMD